MAQMAGAEIKGADIKKWRRGQPEQSFGETVKRKETRERERKVHKTGRQRQTRETEVKRDRGWERPWPYLKTENIPSFSALVHECWYAWELESRKEDGGWAVYTSASQPLLLYLPHGPIKKAQIPFHQHQTRNVFLLTHISSFSIHMIFLRTGWQMKKKERCTVVKCEASCINLPLYRVFIYNMHMFHYNSHSHKLQKPETHIIFSP